MNTEHFGTPYILPEPDIVGNCNACSGEIYLYELTQCHSCDKDIHMSCAVVCPCSESGCKGCYVKDEDTCEYYCSEMCKEVKE